MYRFSKTTNGFYHLAVHAEIPEDAVDVSPEEHAALMQGQTEGKRIVADENGRPVLAEQLPPTPDDLERLRKILLEQSDWVVMRAYECDEPVPAKWKAYRAALRAVDVNAGAVTWPVPPA